MVIRTFPRIVAVVTLVALGAHAQPRPAPAAAAAPPAPTAAPRPPAAAPMAPAPAAPEPSAPADPGQVTVPRLHHAPPAVAPTHAALDLSAEIDFPHLVRRAVVLYRPLPAFGYPTSSELVEAEFLRGAPGPYVAIIPAEAVRAPGLEYTIELELVDGRRVSVFASREAPHRVVVSEDLMDVREHAALERLGGRRSVVSTFVEGVDFGPSQVTTTSGQNAAQSVKDRYYRVEAAYTYRPLRTVDEFSIRVGIVRGYSPVPVDSTINVSERNAVGLNYAAPSLKFRVADAWRLEGELLTSITELGFSLGAGGAVDVGDPYGSKLRVGFETVKTFGTRFFSQVDIQAGDRVRLSPIIEATDMPHADRFGVRLIGEVAYDFGNGFFGAVRGGYQARDATSGGPSGGLRAGYAF